jgi:DnaK suppressor protein
MTTSQIDYNAVRSRLEQEKASLKAQLESLRQAELQAGADEGDNAESADDATDIVVRDRNLAVMSNVRDLLAQVEAALKRLENGTYGICERCGKSIAQERLDVLPYATMCVSCAAAAGSSTGDSRHY